MADLSGLYQLFQMLKGAAGDEGSEEILEEIQSVSFSEGKRIDCGWYSVGVPDGYRAEVNFGERDFMLWLPSEDEEETPDDPTSSSDISLMAGATIGDPTAEQEAQTELQAQTLAAGMAVVSMAQFSGGPVSVVPIHGKKMHAYALEQMSNFQILFSVSKAIKQMRVCIPQMSDGQIPEAAKMVAKWMDTFELEEGYREPDPIFMGDDVPCTVENAEKFRERIRARLKEEDHYAYEMHKLFMAWANAVSQNRRGEDFFNDELQYVAESSVQRLEEMCGDAEAQLTAWQKNNPDVKALSIAAQAAAELCDPDYVRADSGNAYRLCESEKLKEWKEKFTSLITEPETAQPEMKEVEDAFVAPVEISGVELEWKKVIEAYEDQSTFYQNLADALDYNRAFGIEMDPLHEGEDWMVGRAEMIGPDGNGGSVINYFVCVMTVRGLYAAFLGPEPAGMHELYRETAGIRPLHHPDELPEGEPAPEAEAFQYNENDSLVSDFYTYTAPDGMLEEERSGLVKMTPERKSLGEGVTIYPAQMFNPTSPLYGTIDIHADGAAELLWEEAMSSRSGRKLMKPEMVEVKDDQLVAAGVWDYYDDPKAPFVVTGFVVSEDGMKYVRGIIQWRCRGTREFFLQQTMGLAQRMTMDSEDDFVDDDESEEEADLNYDEEPGEEVENDSLLLKKDLLRGYAAGVRMTLDEAIEQAKKDAFRYEEQAVKAQGTLFEYEQEKEEQLKDERFSLNFKRNSIKDLKKECEAKAEELRYTQAELDECGVLNFIKKPKLTQRVEQLTKEKADLDKKFNELKKSIETTERRIKMLEEGDTYFLSVSQQRAVRNANRIMKNVDKTRQKGWDLEKIRKELDRVEPKIESAGDVETLEEIQNELETLRKRAEEVRDRE